MRFRPTDDQRDFARSLDALVAAADPVAVNRAWADGNHAPGLALWRRLADQGVLALLVPESAGGAGASAVEMVLAHEVLGRHAVPGPWVEAGAYLPLAVADVDLLGRLAEGAVATVAAAPHAPVALDADVAEIQVLVEDGEARLAEPAGEPLSSVDPSRSWRALRATDAPTPATGDLDAAADHAALATAAHLLGAGEQLLAATVTYVGQRRQFGREIGSYQAVKHALADVRVALDLARPLVWGAAVASSGRGSSAAKVGAAQAAHRAARTALQLHGAIGYTAEHDLSRWLTRVQALRSAWGTPTWHRGRLLDDLLDGRAGVA